MSSICTLNNAHHTTLHIMPTPQMLLTLGLFLSARERKMSRLACSWEQEQEGRCWSYEPDLFLQGYLLVCVCVSMRVCVCVCVYVCVCVTVCVTVCVSVSKFNWCLV